MAYELKNGQGTIFKNQKTSDSHPEYRGVIKTPKGDEYEVSLWVKEGQKGKYFSVAVKEPYQVNQAASNNTSSNTDNEDDLPF